MRLYNPTFDKIDGAFDGVLYPVFPNSSISVSQQTGEWILNKNAFKGLVDISFPYPLPKDFDFKLFMAEKCLQGLEAYQNILRDGVLESFLQLDEMRKSLNQFGSELRSRYVKKVTEKLEHTLLAIKDIEKEYGLSLKVKEAEQRSRSLLDSIASEVKNFEEDFEAQRKAKEHDQMVDKYLKEYVPTKKMKNLNLNASI